MKTHLKIIAFVYLLLGCGGFVITVLGILQYALVMGENYESSVLDAETSLFQQFTSRCHFYVNQYHHFSQAAAMYGFNPIYSLVIALIYMSFGLGLLKGKEWARRLGFVLAALNILEFALAVANNELTILHILVIGLTGYMLWAFQLINFNLKIRR